MGNVKKKIVITGGLGFIFSHVTEHFVKCGYDVMVIDNLSAGSHPELIKEIGRLTEVPGSGSFTFVEYDVSFQPVIPIITTFDPEYIIHAAAISDVDYSIKQPVKTIQANVNGTINVFEAARKLKNLKKLLYVSTDEVYGECDHPKVEDEIIFPKNPYSLSKAFGSIMRLAYDNTYPELKDKTVETRFCNVFGPRQDDRKIIPAIKRALNGGKPVELHNGGNGYRQYIHVSEIPAIVGMLLEFGNRTYNVTTNEGLTVNELIWHTEKITGKKVPTVPGKRSGMDIKYQMNGARLRNEFDWKPKQPFLNHLQDYLFS
jgi:nucleoside-diphosphate-sugar epimerase